MRETILSIFLGSPAFAASLSLLEKLGVGDPYSFIITFSVSLIPLLILRYLFEQKFSAGPRSSFNN